MAEFSLRRLRSAVKGSRRWLRWRIRTRSPRPLRRVLAGYRGARRSQYAPVSRQSRRGLDWMNFFLADVQTGFGSFVAFYLADLGWSKAQVVRPGSSAVVESPCAGESIIQSTSRRRPSSVRIS